jgi:hypothetical protein
MASEKIMADLRELYEELGYPSAHKLFVAARRQGLDVTRRRPRG